MEISVVLPCLNEPETLAKCIKKAKKQIKKLGIKGEIIIADNGSNDGSILIAKKLGATVINVKNKEDLKKYFRKNLLDDEMIIGMGAGSISNWIKEIGTELKWI